MLRRASIIRRIRGRSGSSVGTRRTRGAKLNIMMKYKLASADAGWPYVGGQEILGRGLPESEIESF